MLQWTASLEHCVWKWNEHVFVCWLWTQSIPRIVHLGAFKPQSTCSTETSEDTAICVEQQKHCRLMQLSFSKGSWQKLEGKMAMLWDYNQTVFSGMTFTNLSLINHDFLQLTNQKCSQSSWIFMQTSCDLMLLLWIFFLSTTTPKIMCTVLWSLFPH